MIAPLTILFSGQTSMVKLTDGSDVEVHIRILPQRQLGRLLAACEDQSALIELCCFTKLPPDAPKLDNAPAGYAPVPMGWADNLTDESFEFLHATAQKLNFQRAVKWGQAQITAKKMIAPLHASALENLNPIIDGLVEKMVARIENSSASTRSAPASPAAAAKTS